MTANVEVYLVALIIVLAILFPLVYTYHLIAEDDGDSMSTSDLIPFYQDLISSDSI